MSNLDNVFGKDKAGRRLTYKSNRRRSWTFTDLNPLPIGVVTGAFKATLFFFMELIASSGIKVPYFS